RRYAAHVAARGDATIVQPAKLPPARASEVCGQCHSFWEFADAAAERRANAQGLPYRPGDELAATRFIVQPTKNLESPEMRAFLEADPGFIRDIFWADGMVRATGREYNGLVESPCFKNATTPERTMSCFSCHTMHQTPDDARPVAEWANDQLAPAAVGDSACIRCHPSVGRGIRAAVGAELARPAESLAASQIEAHTHHGERSAATRSAARRCSRHSPPAGRTRATCVISTRRWRGQASISTSGTAHRSPRWMQMKARWRPRC